MHIGVLSLPSNFHAEKWSKALAKAGAQVSLYSLENKPMEGEVAGMAGGVRRVHIPAPLRATGRLRYPDYYLSRKQLRKQLAADKVDVLHPLHLTPFGSWGLWSGFKPSIPAAMGADVLEYPPGRYQGERSFRTWREAEQQHGWLAKLKAKRLNTFYRARVAAVLKRADLVTADNQPLVDAILEWFNVPEQKVRLLRWGLEPELFDFSAEAQAAVRERFGIPPMARVVLAPRGANALYQADVILQAFEQLLADPSTPQNLYFLLLSAGYPVAPSVLAQAQKLQARYPQRFGFVAGQLPRLEVYRLWSAVSAFISAPIYDGYSAAVAEGRYAGAIPIVNAIPGNTEVITHMQNGYIVREFTPQQLATAIQYCMGEKHNELKATFAARNRAWIEQYSLLHVNASRWLQWAEEVVARYR